MPRIQRIEEAGFYHIINRGVERRTIFLEQEDFQTFLNIVEESAVTYHFALHSYCLMPNHYHLLIQTFEKNLSLLMRQINAKYSVYFNKKYNRVGPLWQGRFKSIFVYDETYLSALVKYIEYNPIKANITKDIGEYRWAMSSKPLFLTHMSYDLINSIDFSKAPTKEEEEKMNTVFSAKLEQKQNQIVEVSKKELAFFFETYDKEVAIARAIEEGHLQTTIAKYLDLSTVSISKSYKIFRAKRKLFEALRDRGVFWSYSKALGFEEAGEALTVEYLLKYGDFDELCEGFKLFGKRMMKRIWEEKLVSDQQFIKTNLMIARLFFKMDVESDYFKKKKNGRLEKLKLLTS